MNTNIKRLICFRILSLIIFLLGILIPFSSFASVTVAPGYTDPGYLNYSHASNILFDDFEDTNFDDKWFSLSSPGTIIYQEGGKIHTIADVSDPNVQPAAGISLYSNRAFIPQPFDASIQAYISPNPSDTFGPMISLGMAFGIVFNGGDTLHIVCGGGPVDPVDEGNFFCGTVHSETGMLNNYHPIQESAFID